MAWGRISWCFYPRNLVLNGIILHICNLILILSVVYSVHPGKLLHRALGSAWGGWREYVAWRARMAGVVRRIVHD